jgi:hypothetical protein
MNMYIAQAKSGQFRILKNLGAIDPQEGQVPVVGTTGMRAAV